MARHFDLLIHAQHRLQICAFLSPVESAEFSAIREDVGLSDSLLSKNLSALADAGYVKLNKRTVDSRVRTWVSLTKAGRSAFKGHVSTLQQIVDAATNS